MLTGKYRPNQPRVPPIACRRRWHPAPPLQAARGGKGCQTSPLSSGGKYAERSQGKRIMLIVITTITRKENHETH